MKQITSKPEGQKGTTSDFTDSDYLSQSGLFVFRMVSTIVGFGHLFLALTNYKLIQKETPMERVAERAVVLASFFGMLSHLGSAMAVRVSSENVSEAILVVLELAYTLCGASLVGKVLVGSEILEIAQLGGLFLMVVINVAISKV